MQEVLTLIHRTRVQEITRREFRALSPVSRDLVDAASLRTAARLIRERQGRGRPRC